MKKLLALMLCLLLPVTALAELPMYAYPADSYPQNVRIRQYLSDFICFWGEETVNLGIDRLVPVYSCPSEEGWRAAKGKAAVSLKEPFTALAWSEDEKWLLIDYTIREKTKLSSGQHRIGYISRAELPADFRCPVNNEYLIRVPMTLTKDAWLYDDLNGDMTPFRQVPAGTSLTVLGYVNNGWAYVETELDGQRARTFLPLDVLEAPAETEDAAMMAALEGLWLFIGGGEILADGCRFDGRGTVQFYAAGEYDNFPTTVLVTDGESRPCEYRVYPNLLGEMRYPGVDWVLELRQGSWMERMGLTLSTDEEGTPCLDISQGEGGGGYRFVADEGSITFVQQSY